jgi:hypothetical protein
MLKKTFKVFVVHICIDFASTDDGLGNGMINPLKISPKVTRNVTELYRQPDIQ